MNNNQSNAEAVRQFTEESKNIKCPNKPQALSKDEIDFTVRMVMSELHELMCSEYSPLDAHQKMHELLNDIDMHQLDHRENEEIEKIAEQGDAMVDSWYYMLNVACRNGINLSKIFNIVHGANMAKKDPGTGKFIIRESDGKIMKPEGWKAPDIIGEIKRQADEGSWN